MSDAGSSLEGMVLGGRYKLLARLGAGGMGAVYRAENVLIGRTVAIKVLLPEHVQDKDLAARFLREARAAVIVRHPNVVDVLDIAKDPKAGPFIVQELLEGEDLDEYVTRIGGRLSIPELAELLFPIVDAMALAHSRGVVHRDLKPSNVFLARMGDKTVPKLLDFGISRIKSGKHNARMTETGMLLGSPAYMSPEQIQDSRSVDARSDVWALGVIMYEILSGELPFTIEEPDNVFLLFSKITTVDAPPLDLVAPHVPAEIARIVARCLQRDPKRRYASAAELLRDLEKSPLGSSIPPPTIRDPPPKVPAFKGSLQILVPAPAPAAPAAKPPAHEPPAVGFGFDDPAVSIKLDVHRMRAAAVRQARSDLAHLAPPPSTAKQRAPAQPGTPDEVGTIGTILFAGLLVGAAVGAFGIVRIPDGIMKALWSSPLLTGKESVSTAWAAGLSTVIGGAIGLEATPGKMRAWGPIVSAVGFVVTGLVLGAEAIDRWSVTDPAAVVEISNTLPLAVALVPVGLCVFAGQKAWQDWRAGSAAGYVSSCAFAVLFALGAVVVHAVLFGQ